MSPSNPELPTAVHGLPTHISIYLPIYLALELSKRRQPTAIPKCTKTFPKDLQSRAKTIDLEPKGHARSLKNDPRTRKGA